MVLGVIPSALPKASLLTQAMHKQHPAVDFTILSHSSEELIRALNDFSIEAGITYLDNEPVEGLLQAELYRENYCLFVSSDNELAARPSVTWFEAAQQPLCLLTPNMQNRRIIDRAFAAAKVQPTARLETNHAGLFPQCFGRAGRRGGGAAGRTHGFPQGWVGGSGPRAPVAADCGALRKCEDP
jgi:DNA-binding transcriptional LysR family regulator